MPTEVLDTATQLRSAITRPRVSSAWRQRLVALCVFVALAVLHTWPLATNPAHLSRNDNADTVLNTWAIAWVAHELPRDPLHVYDGNIFYPERYTLAYSEAMLVQSVLAMPVLALGGSPVLAYNLVLLAGLTLTGWAFWLLILRWTGSVPAAYVSGSLAAFNAHVLVRFPHLQTQHPEFVALILFALDALIVRRRVRDAVVLALAFVLQALTSLYLMVFTIWMLVFAVGARAAEWLRGDWRRIVKLAAVAMAIAVVLLTPYLLPYWELHRINRFERSLEDARGYTGTWMDYLSTGSRLYFPLFGERYFNQTISCTFPGFTAILLVIAALARRETRSDPRVRMCVIAAIGCGLVSMAPQLSWFPLLYRLIPLFWIVRVNARLGQIVLLMIAVVAGFGMANLVRGRQRASRVAMTAVAMVLVTVEVVRAPLGYEPFVSVPRVYDVLAKERHAVVIEIPFWAPSVVQGNAPYMLASTTYWHPLVNGYSGFRPPSYDETYVAIAGFPDPAALVALKQRGVTDIVVHRAMVGADRLAAVKRIGSLEPVADDGDIVIYRLH